MKVKQDPVLAGFVQLTREVMGADLIAILLFGSRARGSATSASDYDFLLVVQTEPDDEVKKNLVLGTRGSVSMNFQFEKIPDLIRELERGDTARLNMVTEGKLLWGSLPPTVYTAAKTALHRFGMVSRPIRRRKPMSGSMAIWPK